MSDIREDRFEDDWVDGYQIDRIRTDVAELAQTFEAKLDRMKYYHEVVTREDIESWAERVRDLVKILT